MNIACPKCQRKLPVDESMNGRKAQCATCGGTFTISLGQAPPSIPPVSYGVTPAPVQQQMLLYQCPHCQLQLQAPESSAGQIQLCPQCRQQTVVPVQRAAFYQAQQMPPYAAPSSGPVYSSPMPTRTVHQGKTKTSAGLLALFLGGLGIHKFYLGGCGWGLLYLFFCWTWIPAIVSFIEAIMHFASSEQEFDRKYNFQQASAFTW